MHVTFLATHEDHLSYVYLEKAPELSSPIDPVLRTFASTLLSA